jgi:asparagine synthase (glutamine-hydrolysing)
LDLKIEPKNNTTRKLVLRQLAENLGLKKRVVDRPKKALQYTTGVNKALKNLAKNNGQSVNEYVQETFRRIFTKMVFHG